MSTFWQSLHRLAQDQLFTGGYLSPSTALEIERARKRAEAQLPASTPQNKRPDATPASRLHPAC